MRLTRLQGAVLVYGAGTLIAQVLILRELLVLAQGQELKLALGLWGWLLWTGLGALLGGRRGRTAFSPPPRPSPLKGEGEKAADGDEQANSPRQDSAVPTGLRAHDDWSGGTGVSAGRRRIEVHETQWSPPWMKNPPYPPFSKGGLKSPPLAKGDLGGFEVFPVKPGGTKSPGARLGGLLTLLGLLLPATILAIRAVPTLAHLPGGQSLPLGTGLVLILSLLAPFCLVSGYFFPWACRTLANSGPGGTGRVYSLETLGAALGVVLLQLFLLGRYGGLALSLATGLLLALSPLVLDRHQGWQRRGVQLTVALLLASGLYGVTPLEQLARSRQMPGRRVVATADSPYAFLSASREDGQVSFFANNLWQFTYPDPFTAEHRVQLGLLAHPDPRRVLLLGGGVGLVPEILKTGSVSRLDYVELDPRLVDLAQGLLPGAGAWLRDPRVRLIHRDARHFVAVTPERYDVILMVLPEPRSAQLNRFYTREFFRLVAGKLAPGGVFNFSLAGSETSLHPWRAAYLALAYHTLGQAFPEVLALPGERVQFFGATASGVLAADPELLMARLKERRLPLQYVREYYLTDDLAPAKVAYLRQVLDRQPAELNTDLTPRCYFYDLALGGIQEDLPIGRVLLALKHLPAYLLWAALGLATLILAAALRGRPGPLCLYQVTVMGLGTMALEILVLILYQIHLGSLYRQLGLLIAVFMAGMGGGAAVGGFLVGGGAGRPERGRVLGGWLAGLQIMLGLLALSLALFLSLSPFAALPVPDYLIQGGFALIMAVAGFGGGGIFALSAWLWFRERGESGNPGGLLYAVDLLGSTLGALGFSFLMVPVWGIWPALILVAAVHGGAALMLLTRKSVS